MPANKAASDIPLLYTLRWISAFIVMAGHSYSILFHHSFSHSPISAGSVIEYFAQFRSAAVYIFFAISGYLIGGGVIKNIGSFNFKRYSINRFSRIYIVIIPAIFLTAALDYLAYLIDRNNIVYVTTVFTGTQGISQSVFDNYSPIRIASTILSLESVLGEPMGSNRALWSLGLEWVFYFILPIAAVAFRKLFPAHKKYAVAAAVVFLSALLVLFIHAAVAPWAVWMFAACCANRNPGPRAARIASGVGALLALCAFMALPAVSTTMISHGSSLRIDLLDILLGAGISLIFLSKDALFLHINIKFDKIFADMSYSLYVVHMPILIFATFLLNRFEIIGVNGLAFNVRSFVYFIIILAIEITVAAIFAVLFENHTDQLKAYLLGSSRSAHRSVG